MLGRHEAVVYVHDVGLGVERLAHDPRQLLLDVAERPVDLRHQRCLHRGSRRHLDDLHGRAVAAPDLGQCRPDRQRDLVALSVAVVLVDQVHLDVAELRPAAQVVLADQAVEIDRRGRARVDLVVGDFGQFGDPRREFVQDPRGLLERRALGHVHDDLEL